MRVASWVFVLAAVVGAVGVFLPSIELQLAGKAVSRRTQISLYTASRDRELVRKLVVAYHASSKRQLGGEVLRKVTPHVGGRVRGALDDARDAMDALDDTSDDDVRTAAIVFTAALAALLALDGLMILLVFPQLMRGAFRRGPLIAALAASVLAAAIAVALHVACREAIWQANDEVGRTTLALAAGAYVIPLSALTGLGAAIALLVRRGGAPLSPAPR
ncbi:MAG TPA: hypothetical protein VFD36_20110 [Kofleriaceae bacterium]|nr:hypothetical protein [Kofleriaceae bacterium]